MGWWLLLLLVWLPGGVMLAQSVADDTEQLILDVQKLTQLKQILQEMYQAYTIIHSGYETIKSISEGTFDLHKAFLDGLLLVNPDVANYYKVVDIVNKEVALVSETKSANQYLRSSGVFTSAELGTFLTTYNNLVQGSLNAVSELTMVITAGSLRMSDAERLEAIDRIDAGVTGQLSFLRQFDNGAALQALQRAKAQGDIGTIQGLYGIGP